MTVYRNKGVRVGDRKMVGSKTDERPYRNRKKKDVNSLMPTNFP